MLGEWPVEVAVVCEGSEEQSSGGMEALARGRTRSWCSATPSCWPTPATSRPGLPTLTTSLRGTGSVLMTVRTMTHPAHSGMFGGAAPDALQALLMALASLRDATGETTIDGLDHDGVWDGAPFDTNRFREDAGLARRRRAADRARGTIGDLLWARPAATVLAIDCPPISQVTAAAQGEARAVVNLRVPADTDAAAAQQLLIAHLRAHTPFGAQVEIKPVSLGQGFRARTDGPAYAAMRRAMRTAFGRDAVTTGQGGSIPLATALAELVPDAEIMLLGVEEPASRIHAPGESVDPDELRRTALTQALFLADLGGLLRRRCVRVRWVWAFLDLPEHGLRRGGRVLAGGDPRRPCRRWRGDREAVRDLAARPTGDAWVKVQRVGGRGGVHVDLDVDVPLETGPRRARCRWVPRSSTRCPTTTGCWGWSCAVRPAASSSA